MIMTNRFSFIRRITLLLVILTLNITLLHGTEYISVYPYEIKFNYESGQANDALTIRKADGSAISNPEWYYYDDESENENFAYIKSQTNRKIQVRFDSNCEDMHLIVKLTVTSGTGPGEICNLFVCNYHQLDWITLTLSGTLPGTVGRRTFTWEWEIYGIPINDPGFCATWETTETTHTYFTLINVPKLPQTEPEVDILDYACGWATGSSTEYQVCTNILSNGFNQHYTYSLNCERLSSDFVHLVSSLGITAYLHRWVSKSYEEADIGDMTYQETDAIDPVGPTYGNHAYYWPGHQWAEAASYQWDPSANNSLEGNWGNYEDYLFTHYERVDYLGHWGEWVENQSGQSSGCEAEGHRYYYQYPTVSGILFPFQDPTR